MKLELGTEFTLGEYQVMRNPPNPITWIVAHIEDDKCFCISKDILDNLCYDAREVYHKNWSISKCGNNNYQLSNIHQWLNSDAKPGNWFTPQHDFDEPPMDLTGTEIFGNPTKVKPYINFPGFLYHWSYDEKSILKEVALDNLDTKTKVWLPSIDQMREWEEFSRGSVFRTAEILESTLNQTNEVSNIFTKSSYWTSTPEANTSFVNIVDINGDLTLMSHAYNGLIGVRPCICICENELNSISD